MDVRDVMSKLTVVLRRDVCVMALVGGRTSGGGDGDRVP